MGRGAFGKSRKKGKEVEGPPSPIRREFTRRTRKAFRRCVENCGKKGSGLGEKGYRKGKGGCCWVFLGGGGGGGWGFGFGFGEFVFGCPSGRKKSSDKQGKRSGNSEGGRRLWGSTSTSKLALGLGGGER